MKISMMSYTLARGGWGKNPDIAGLCRFTRELGLEGVDWVTLYGREAGEVRRIMDDHGLKTVCHTFFVDLNFPEAELRRPGLEELKRGVEAAVKLGTDKVMLPIRSKPEFSREESRRNVIEGLREGIRFAAEAGVRLSVEHFPDPRSPFVVSDDVNQALREIPELGVTFDSGNVLTGGEDPVAGFLKSKDRIIHAHFKDWVRTEGAPGRPGLDGKFYQPALVGEGIVDHRSVLEAMRRAGYRGYINLEYEGNLYTPEAAMVKGLDFLKGLLESRPD